MTQNKSMVQIYRAYGLSIASEFELPELYPIAESQRVADLSICRGKVVLPNLSTTTIQRQGVTAAFGGEPQLAYLHWEGVASFEARSGSQLVVEPANDGIDLQLLNLYILSEALGLILWQRELFLLHASAIQIGQQVVIFMGAPGAGKSTTAAAFVQQGHPCFGDDMVAMRLVEGGAEVYPAFAQVKIWRSSVAGLGYEVAQTPTLFNGSLKHRLCSTEHQPLEPLPLAHIFVLEPGDRLGLSRIQGHAAFMALAKFFPCPPQLLQGEMALAHMRQCQKIAQQIPIWRMERPNNFVAVQKFVGWLEKAMQDGMMA